MYIKSLSYEDQSTGWKLEKIEFNNLLTLLVGVSGAGKTQILKALLNLLKISRGSSFNGLKWEIEFSTSVGHDCRWNGAFENKKSILKVIDYKDEKNKPLINHETLTIDGEIFITRDNEHIIFNKVKIPVKLSQQESIISLLKEEEKIKDIYQDFGKIIFNDNSGGKQNHMKIDFDIFGDEVALKLKKIKSLSDIRNSDESIKTKLFLLYKNKRELFDEIVTTFIDIFPYVENIKYDTIHNEYKIHDAFQQYPLIQIKEKNVPDWILEFKISSGMLKTLVHIAELYLCADNSVILIDEFENSLGINCIDELTSSILTSERNLQFIITSHHPYIINDIGFAHWKIVTRKGSVVTATDAEKFGIGRSKHQAFTQLANLTAYSEGIES